jgi:hypothetical protein
MKPVIFLFVGFAAFIAAGCENNQSPDTTSWDQNRQLRQQISDLKTNIEKLEVANKQLQEQMTVLSKLPTDVNLYELYGLKKIVIAKRSGLYDKDKDGRKENLIVYLRALDDEGDAFKATGKVEIELWDLNREPKEALLAKWHVEPGQLKKLWVSGILTHYYRLSFDLAEEIEETKELTVKAHFTDYLTGKVLVTQTTIKP